MLASHQFFNPVAILDAAVAFVAFGLTASSAYLLNDLMDLTADRHHPRKRRRPFASGDLPPSAGFWLVPSLLLGASALAALLPPYFAVVLVGDLKRLFEGVLTEWVSFVLGAV